MHQATPITALPIMNMMTFPPIHINQGMVINDIRKTHNNAFTGRYQFRVRARSSFGFFGGSCAPLLLENPMPTRRYK
jgi:hypothetical protein